TNPAGIGFQDDVQATMGVFASVPRLTVQYDGSPERLLNAFPGSNKDIEEKVGPILGIVMPGQALTDVPLDFPWAVGFGLYLPGESAFTQRALRNEELFDVIFQERDLAIALIAFGAFRLHPTLSLGAGISVNAAVPTVVDTLASPDGRQFSNSDVDTQGSPAFTLGVQWRPTDRLSFGASFIQEQRLSVRGTASVQLALVTDAYPFIPPAVLFGLPPTVSRVRFITGYTPAQFQVGASYKITEQLEVDLALQYQKWDRYKTTTASTPPNKFDNIWIPRVGVEYLLTRDFALRGGFSYEPTPVTEQPQGFNLLGADRFIPSAGFGWRFEDPFGYFTKKISLDFAAFYQYIKPRTFDTGTGPPPLDQLTFGELLGLALLVPDFLAAI
ncbi:MAG: outer membrane protein transport protein, partial [Candidatus Methylomirabilis sp.]|nr:outer membrane protein transport protein [Deltaproteobacteria bacterium]